MLRVFGLFIIAILVWALILGVILHFIPELPPVISMLAGMIYGGFAMGKCLDIGYDRGWVK